MAICENSHLLYVKVKTTVFTANLTKHFAPIVLHTDLTLCINQPFSWRTQLFRLVLSTSAHMYSLFQLTIHSWGAISSFWASAYTFYNSLPLPPRPYTSHVAAMRPIRADSHGLTIVSFSTDEVSVFEVLNVSSVSLLPFVLCHHDQRK